MKKLLLLLLLMVGVAAAQPGNPQVQFRTTDPSGACAAQPMWYNYTLGKFWGCKAGTWTLLSDGVPTPTTPGSPSGSIQFNNAGAFGGSADFTRDLVTGAVNIGGLPVTPFASASLFIGPNESTLPVDLQGAAVAKSLLVTAVTTTNFAAFGVESVAGYGAYFINKGDGTNSSNGIEVDSYAGGAFDTTGIYNYVNTLTFNVPNVYGIYTEILKSSGTPVNAYGWYVEDITLATNNYAFKSGAGMVEVGDATKAAGIHVKGVGAFDVDGAGSNALFWLDTDNSNAYQIVLTNRLAGLTHFASLDVNEVGEFSIVGDTGDAYGELRHLPSVNQWQISGNPTPSLRVSSWISTLRNTAPADGDIAANENSIWFDPTNAATFAMFKGKSANGTVVTGGFSLNTVSAPSPSTIVLPTSVYGGAAQLLGGPTAWGSVVIAGTTYKIPLY